MKTIIKAVLLVAVILFSWNVTVKEGQAANNSVATAKEIKEYEEFHFEVDFTKDDFIANDTYGKYYKVTIPTKGKYQIFHSGTSKVSMLTGNGNLIDIVDSMASAYGVTDTFNQLNPGTYYLLVESTEKFLEIAGYFTYVFSETESNNTLETANVISINAHTFLEVNGTFNDKNGTDTDYYKFTAEHKVNSFFLLFNGVKNLKNADTIISLLDSKGKKMNYDYDIWDDKLILSTYLPEGTYYLKVESTPDTYGKNYSFAPSIAKVTPAVKASDVIVKNNITSDTITMENLVVGWKYDLYWEDGDISFIAEDTTKTITVGQLGENAGSILIFAKDLDVDSEWSVETEVHYGAEKVLGVTPVIKASNVTVQNKFNTNKDSITFKNLVKGSTYTIYKDTKKKTKLASFTAKSTTKTLSVDKLSTGAGAIYVTVTKPKYSESATTKVSYKAEKLPSLSSKNVNITNKIGNDKIALKGLTKGYTYTIYTDSKLKKKLTSFKATGKTKTLSVKQVGAKAGTLYIVASKSGYSPSAATKVSFKAQPTAALASKNVKIKNGKEKDTIKFTGLKKGTTYVIYKDAKKKTKLATFKATSSTKTVSVKQLGTKAGKVYITAQAPSYTVSSLTTVSYSKQK